MARDEEESQGCAPEWITTFADMMSLLLTFFVFILTFSTIEMETYHKVQGALTGALGVAPQDKSRIPLKSEIPPPELDIPPADQGPEKPPEEQVEQIDTDIALAVRKVTDEDDVFEVEKYPEGILVRPSEGVYAPQETRLSSKWRRMIRNVADVMKPRGKRFLVRGYTDRDFLPTREHPTPVDMEMARAVEVAAVLADAGIPASNIEIRGRAAREYPFPNETRRDRARNRTFEIVVIDG